MFGDHDPFMADDDFHAEKEPWLKPKPHQLYLDKTKKVKSFKHELNLKKEYERIFLRHRIDLAKWYFEKDGGYTLKEFKRIFKTEIEENPDRYIIESNDQDIDEILEKEMAQAYKQAEAEGPMLVQNDADISAEHRALKDKINELVPQIKTLMAKHKDYKKRPAYNQLAGDLCAAEDNLKKTLRA